MGILLALLITHATLTVLRVNGQSIKKLLSEYLLEKISKKTKSSLSITNLILSKHLLLDATAEQINAKVFSG
jgi:hypothetical protein